MLCRLLSPISYARGADVERIRITTETACCLARGAGNCAYSQPGSFALSFLQGDAKTLHLVLRADFPAACGHPLLVIEDTSHRYAETAAVLAFFHHNLYRGRGRRAF